MQIHSRKISILGILIIILFIFFMIFLVNILGIFKENEVEAVSLESTDEKEKLHINQNPINLDSILDENTGENSTWEMSWEEVDLEYTTIYNENDSLPSGTIYVTQARNRWN